MRVPLSWLREWVDFTGDAAALGRKLTARGFELEASGQAAPPFSGVVIAEILEASPHPQADKLQVCRVSRGSGEPLQIVCGARNARAGLKVALAEVGASLPGGLAIKAAKLRGVESAGMLCSAKELGLAEVSEGILELPDDAPVAQTLRTWLDLDDEFVELNITPNRGDAMSVLGIAREVAAIEGGAGLKGPRLDAVANSSEARQTIHLDWPEASPRFAGRIIRGVDNARASPLWLRERLRRAGQRSISPLVDATNYVLLEFGQPMHAYDAKTLKGAVRTRRAQAGECLVLLDGQEITFVGDELVIADDEGAIAFAGVMGGLRTAVTAATTEVFLECAWFAPPFVAGRGRRHGLHTEGSQRFERGVDPAGQERAIERATQLLLQIAGGQAGPVVLRERPEFVPVRTPLVLRRDRLTRLLGQPISDAGITGALGSLGFDPQPVEGGWRATAPSYRFDVAREADLIEEVARHVGFDAIEAAPAIVAQHLRALPSGRPEESSLLELLAARGYHEAIHFAFVDPARQKSLFPELDGVAVANPIAADLAVMRVSLWPGLLKSLAENLRRQQSRVRLVEHGTVFLQGAGGLVREPDRLAGIACGARDPEQWGLTRAEVDFYDVKADVEALFATAGAGTELSFEPQTLSCLHPGRSARILRAGRPAGWLGELHPRLVRELDLTYVPVLFELEVEALVRQLPAFQELSRFPQVRRDIAVVVAESTPLSAIRESVTLSASSLLRELRVFDVYRGQGVETGRKSVALGLILQDNSRTLTVEDADRVVAAIVGDLAGKLDAKIRD